MPLQTPIRRLSLALQEASKSFNQASSRAFTTHHYHHDNLSEDDFVSCQHPSFNHSEKQPINVKFNQLVQFLQHGHKPTPYIINQLVSSCAKLGSVFVGTQVHSTIHKMGLISNVYICSALVDMYGKSGFIHHAQQVFDEMSLKIVIAWNSLISGYIIVNYAETAFKLFKSMIQMGIAPTPFSVSTILTACSQLEASELGIMIHALSFKYGFCYNVVIGTGLIDMYSKCCNVENSRRVFNEMPDRNVITWTSMVTGYAQNKKPDETMILAKKMMGLNLRPNHVTYNSLLGSFSCPEDFNHGKQVHCRIIREGLESNEYLVVSLMTLYSECSRDLNDFRKICSFVTKWDQISWNALIGGCSNLESGKEAINYFCVMRQEGFEVDFFTFTSILRAIGIISAIDEGKQIHGLVLKTGHSFNLYVQNGLVSMYARCGVASDSKSLFFSMKNHDLISWNSLLSGFSHHGDGKEAVKLFELMRKSGTHPDSTTYLSILSACSHAGLLDTGLEYFNLMINDDSIDPPKVEHYACIVDLYGRAGYLDEAEEFIKSMPIKPGPPIFKALLSACQVHGDMEIAERCAKVLMNMCPNDPAIYVLLSHVFTTSGYFDDAEKMRKLMCDRGVKKEPGYSQI